MITIFGGGIAGMLAAYVFTEYEPRVIEASDKLGGNFLAGGLKYLHDTPAMRQLLTDLGIDYHPTKSQGRIFHFGELRHHPDYLQACDPGTRRGIQRVHWHKTRHGDASDEAMEKCMNDPLGNHAALECDLEKFILRLAQWTHANSDVWTGAKVTDVRIDGDDAWYDATSIAHGKMSYHTPRIITTLPLNVLKAAAPSLDLPTASVSKLLIVECAVHLCHRSRAEPWLDWDYIYTPDAALVSRIYRGDHGMVMAEVPLWLLDGDSPTSDEIDEISDEVRRAAKLHYGLIPVATKVIPGHLRPLAKPLALPPQITALGRFAAWDSRATSDKVLDQALDLKRTWYGPQLPVE